MPNEHYDIAQQHLPRLTLIVLRALDPKQLSLFYSALGFRFSIEQHGSGPQHYVSEDPGFTFEIYPRREGAPDSAALRLGFVVKSLEGTIPALTALGGALLPGSSRQRTILRDPEGHTLELTESGVNRRGIRTPFRG